MSLVISDSKHIFMCFLTNCSSSLEKWLFRFCAYFCSDWFPLLMLSCSVQPLSHVWLFVTHGLQHARLPCPPPTPGVCSNSCPLRQWCHPVSSPSPPASIFQHQGHFQWVCSSHQVAKVLEYQLQHQSFYCRKGDPLGSRREKPRPWQGLGPRSWHTKASRPLGVSRDRPSIHSQAFVLSSSDAWHSSMFPKN